jgi:hypothetical protein
MSQAFVVAPKQICDEYYRENYSWLTIVVIMLWRKGMWYYLNVYSVFKISTPNLKNYHSGEALNEDERRICLPAALPLCWFRCACLALRR